MQRERIEIEDELAALRELRGKVPTDTAFGDNNQDAIDAQIRVIDERMRLEQTIETFEFDAYTLSSALTAVSWLWEDDEAPSTEWQEMLEVEETDVIGAVA